MCEREQEGSPWGGQGGALEVACGQEAEGLRRLASPGWVLPLTKPHSWLAARAAGLAKATHA